MTAESKLYGSVPAEQRQILQAFRANHPYKEVDVDGASWRYLACGQGERALLFLPGGFLAADMWFYSILALEEGYRIVVPDSYPRQGVFSMDSVCQALVRSLEAEGIERATAIGLSAGGGVAQIFIQAYPERVEHVVFSHCGIVEPNPEAEGTLNRLLWLVRLLPMVFVRRVILSKTAGSPLPTSQWIAFHNAYFREVAQRIDREMVLRFLQAGLKTRRSFAFKPEVMTAWGGEVLILSSEDDQATVGSVGKLQARYPQARTHLLPEGGHHTFMFFPEAYTAALKEFLGALPPMG